MAKLPVTDIADIYKFTRSGSTEQYAATPAYGAVNICVSPTGTDIQPGYGDVASFQLFEIFIYDATVKIDNGDKIVTADDVEYLVSGKPYVVNNSYMNYIRCLAKQIA